MPQEGGGGQEHHASWSSGTAALAAGAGPPSAGWCAARPGRTRGAATAPLTQVAMTTVDDQDWSGPSEMPYIKSPSPAPPSTKPGTSKRPASIASTFCRKSAPKTTATMPIGHVDEEHPAPGEVGDQEAAQHRSDRGGHGGAEGEDAGRPHPLGRREDPVEHGHPDGGHHAAARTLDDAEQHQLGHVLGHAAQRRADGEDDDGGQEDPLATEAVSQPARRRDEDGQAHQVGDHDTVDSGGGDVEVAADGGERDVHDRDVHDVHEHRRHEHDADGDLLIHARDGHVLFRFSRSAGAAGTGLVSETARPGCAPRPYALARPRLGRCPTVRRRARRSPRLAGSMEDVRATRMRAAAAAAPWCVVAGVLTAACRPVAGGPRPLRAASSTVWLCRPGQAPDPCTRAGPPPP